MGNFTIKERRAIEMYKAGDGFRRIRNCLGFNQSEIIDIIGKYHRTQRNEESTCKNCEWRIDGNTFCVLPKCFLQNLSNQSKMKNTL